MKNKCPFCNVALTIPDECINKTVVCPKCKQSFIAYLYDTKGASSANPDPTPVVKPPMIAVPPKPPTLPPTPVVSTETEPVKEDIKRIIHGGIFVLACVIAQSLVRYLPGADTQIWKTDLGGGINIGLSILMFLMLLRLLFPLRRASAYYISLIFQSSSLFTQRPDLQTKIFSAGTNFILLVYIGIIYQSVLPSFLEMIQILTEPNAALIKLIRLGIICLVIIFLVKLILAIVPLLRYLSESLTERAMKLTKKVDSKICSSCGVQNNKSANFCSSCGKPV